MRGRRTIYEIYWEILIYCKSPRSFTSIINRCDLNSKIGQEHLEFLETRGYLEIIQEETRTSYRTTAKADGYIDHFTHLYQSLFDTIPRFKI
jgi:predicted transcriptional regulator